MELTPEELAIDRLAAHGRADVARLGAEEESAAREAAEDRMVDMEAELPRLRGE